MLAQGRQGVEPDGRLVPSIDRRRVRLVRGVRAGREARGGRLQVRRPGDHRHAGWNRARWDEGRARRCGVGRGAPPRRVRVCHRERG